MSSRGQWVNGIYGSCLTGTNISCDSIQCFENNHEFYMTRVFSCIDQDIQLQTVVFRQHKHNTGSLCYWSYRVAQSPLITLGMQRTIYNIWLSLMHTYIYIYMYIYIYKYVIHHITYIYIKWSFHIWCINQWKNTSFSINLCVSAYFLSSLHCLSDCNDDDAWVMKNLKRDVGGRSTEACILSGWNPVAVIAMCKYIFYFSNNYKRFILIFISVEASLINASFSGSHHNYYAFMFLLFICMWWLFVYQWCKCHMCNSWENKPLLL